MLSIKSHREIEPNATPNLWGEVLDEGHVIAIQPVAQIEGCHGNGLRRMLMAKGVGTIHIEYRIDTRRSFRGEEPVLSFGHHRLRRDTKTIVIPFESNASAQWRY